MLVQTIPDKLSRVRPKLVGCHPLGSATLPPGTKIDQYVVQAVLGRGGFGTTYRVLDEDLQKEFALKEFFPEGLVVRDGQEVRFTGRPDVEKEFQWALKRFYDEARLLAKLSHPSIVATRRVFEANNSAYMLLDLVQGSTFERWLNGLDTPPTQEELELVTDPLLSALELIHQSGIFHLDISPDNIMIRAADGVPILLDFGAARFQFRQRSRASISIFKKGYSAPELYTSTTTLMGAWTDIYSLAATLYRAISGQVPIEATTRQMKDEQVLAVHVGEGRYRKEYLRALDWALALRPENRPQSVSEWRAALLEGARAPEQLKQFKRTSDDDKIEFLARLMARPNNVNTPPQLPLPTYEPQNPEPGLSAHVGTTETQGCSPQAEKAMNAFGNGVGKLALEAGQNRRSTAELEGTDREARPHETPLSEQTDSASLEKFMVRRDERVEDLPTPSRNKKAFLAPVELVVIVVVMIVFGIGYEFGRVYLEGRGGTPETKRQTLPAKSREQAPSAEPESAKRLAEARRVEEILEQATQRVRAGDLRGARELLAAAEDGAQGAVTFALAETYDPNILAAWGARGVVSDVVKAKVLYHKALEFGIERARMRLEALDGGRPRFEMNSPFTVTIATPLRGEPASRVRLPIEIRPSEAVPKNGFVRIHGLPPAAALSEGHAFAPGAWAVPLIALPTLTIILPAGVQGQSDVGVSLVSIDGGLLAEAHTQLVIAFVIASPTVPAAIGPIPLPPAAPQANGGFVAVVASKKSRMDALKAFADLQQKYAEVLAAKTPDVQEVNLGDKGVWYRAVVGPPGSREAATGVCSQLKSAGHAGCWVAAY
jgi:serine/threonine protein kinase